MANKKLERLLEDEVLTIGTIHLKGIKSGKQVLIQHRLNKGMLVNSNARISSTGTTGNSKANISFNIDGKAEVDIKDHPTEDNPVQGAANYLVTGKFSCDLHFEMSIAKRLVAKISNNSIQNLQVQQMNAKTGKFPSHLKKKAESMLSGIGGSIVGRIAKRASSEANMTALTLENRKTLL